MADSFTAMRMMAVEMSQFRASSTVHVIDWLVADHV
jgi:hypothetical protein